MTLVVPYSFVPGTKAKASEVNANFNDVLNKIENTNTLINNINEELATNLTKNTTDLEKKIEDTKNISARNDLSNLTPEANARFDSKANAIDLDGNVTCISVALLSNVIITKDSRFVFNIGQHIPNDGCKYLVNISAEFAGAPGMQPYFNAFIQNGSYIANFIRFNTSDGSCNITIPVDASRTIILWTIENTSPRTIFLYLKGYRKVR